MRSLHFTCIQLLAFLIVALFTTAVQANSASATAPASAEIISTLCVINLNGTGLAFGSVVPMTGGTVTVAPDGTRTSSGSVTVVTSSIASAALFQVSGLANNSFSISLPGSAVISSSTNNMTVDTFTSNPASAAVLDNTGKRNFTVGGVLRVNNGQPTGHYTGTFTVTVAYN